MPSIPASARSRALLLRGLLVLATGTAALAQGQTLAIQDYARAERFMPYITRPLVDHDVRTVHWLEDGRFWYVDHDAQGDHYLSRDVRTGTTAPLFDQVRLAALLTKASGKPVAAGKLGLTDVRPLADGRFEVALAGRRYLCDLQGAGSCVDPRAALKTGKEPGVLSPDRHQEAFIRGWNLWVRDLATGQETKLTTDGVENFGYATDNAGWEHSDRAIVVWSPDSTKIATFQQDQRQDGDMYLVSTQVGHPRLEAWKYPLPGDAHVTMIQRVIIDVPERRVVRLQMPPDFHRSTLSDDLSSRPHGTWDDVKWAPDGRTLAFVSTSRDHKHEALRIADAATGAVRTVYHEDVATFYESGNGEADWRYLPATQEAIWFSEKTNWGNLYLVDLATGLEKRAITTGEGNVTEVLRVDPKTRTVWFRGVGRTPGVQPYYQQFWRVGLDGGKPVLLTPEAADHTITMSKDGRYFVDSYSTPTTAPVTVLREAEHGRVLATVAKADLSRLVATGWKPPVPITVKARDGKTNLYGLMFTPTHLDPHRKYPVVDYIYPGPQEGSVFSFSFLPADGDNQALSELGFIVVALDGMGTPWRSKAFQDVWYGDMGDNTLPDQVAGLRELGQRHAWMDLGRVGIWGHSGGGNATADAMFRYPDFFKVGWAESGNHDNRVYEDDWGERYQGLLVAGKNGTTNYDNQANQKLAGNLKGRLMLVHGTMDDNVPPNNTLLVVDALIKANKDFDLLMIPNAAHGYGAATPYVTRRRWDYFVRHLAGGIPPVGFALKPWPWF